MQRMATTTLSKGVGKPKAGKNGMLHAPTGSGKTYALWGGIMQEALQQEKHPVGLQALWITPLRALAVEIQQATQRMTEDLQL